MTYYFAIRFFFLFLLLLMQISTVSPQRSKACVVIELIAWAEMVPVFCVEFSNPRRQGW